MKRRDILKLIGAAPLAAFPLPAIARVPELPPVTKPPKNLASRLAELLRARGVTILPMHPSPAIGARFGGNSYAAVYAEHMHPLAAKGSRLGMVILNGGEFYQRHIETLAEDEFEIPHLANLAQNLAQSSKKIRFVQLQLPPVPSKAHHIVSGDVTMRHMSYYHGIPNYDDDPFYDKILQRIDVLFACEDHGLPNAPRRRQRRPLRHLR